jgi:hypothetical protein
MNEGFKGITLDHEGINIANITTWSFDSDHTQSKNSLTTSSVDEPDPILMVSFVGLEHARVYHGKGAVAIFMWLQFLSHVDVLGGYKSGLELGKPPTYESIEAKYGEIIHDAKTTRAGLVNGQANLTGLIEAHKERGHLFNW